MAQFNLGYAYAEGMGVPQDFPEALRWFRKAHEQGYEQAAEEIEEVLRRQRRQQGAAAVASPPPPPSPSPLSPTASSSPSPIPIGTRVILFGLTGKRELNGQPGIVTEFVAASGRLKVTLEDGRGPYSLLPKNLHEELD
jgi:TPR repeat protein